MIRCARAFLTLTFLVAGLGVTSVVAQSEENLGTPMGNLTVPDVLDDADVREVVAYSLAARGWTLKSKAEDRVIGHLVHRGYDATVTFILKGPVIEMYCEGYRISKSGERQKPAIPEGWIANLKKDIPKRLGMKAATK